MRKKTFMPEQIAARGKTGCFQAAMESIRAVLDVVEWSGTLSSSAIRTKDRIDKLSLARHAIPRSESIPSK